MSRALVRIVATLVVFAVFLIAFLVAPLGVLGVFAAGLAAAERARRRA